MRRCRSLPAWLRTGLGTGREIATYMWKAVMTDACHVRGHGAFPLANTTTMQASLPLLTSQDGYSSMLPCQATVRGTEHTQLDLAIPHRDITNSSKIPHAQR